MTQIGAASVKLFETLANCFRALDSVTLPDEPIKEGIEP